MANNSPTANQTPGGVVNVNDKYTINNDYLYPKAVVPPMLRGIRPGNNGRLIGPFSTTALVRGWIYPCDVDADSFVRAAGYLTPEAQTAASQVAQDALAETRHDQLVAEQADPRMVFVAAHPSEGLALDPAGVGPVMQGGGAHPKPKRIRYSEGKQFQFNPFAISLTVEFQQAAADPATLQQGGTSSETQVGMAQTGIEMFFDRSMEVAAATAGIKRVNGYAVDPIFADIGVQKDLWDVYRIILGGDQDYFAKIGTKLLNVDTVFGMQVRDGSTTDMTNRLFDLGLAGSSAWGRPVAVYYNPNLVIIGWVSSMAFTYAEFNANYVPTKAKMDMGLQVLYTTSESGADTFVSTDNGTTTSTSSSDDEVANSSSTHTTNYSSADSRATRNADQATRTSNGRVTYSAV